MNRYDATPPYPDHMRITAQRILLKQLAAQCLIIEDPGSEHYSKNYFSFRHDSHQAMIVASCFAEQEGAIFSKNEGHELLTASELYSLL